MSAGLLSVKATPHWPTQSSWSRPDLLDDLTTMGAARFGATPASHVVLATPSARFWDAQRGAEGSVMTIINQCLAVLAAALALASSATALAGPASEDRQSPRLNS